MPELVQEGTQWYVVAGNSKIDAGRNRRYAERLLDEYTHVTAYEDMTKDELQHLLEERGLPKTGNKDDLIARLQESD